MVGWAVKEVEYRIGCETLAKGEEEVKELLEILEEGLAQCKRGEGISTEEIKKRLKEKAKKLIKKHKKD